MLRKEETKRIIRENGIWFSEEPYKYFDQIIEETVKDIIIRTAKVMKEQKRKIITKEAIDIGVDKHRQSHIANITEKIVNKLTDILVKEGDMIAGQYRSGTQINN
jgi:histone H3/H4